MPYSIYEQQQQLLERRTINETNSNPYGITGSNDLNRITANQAVFNENTESNQNNTSTNRPNNLTNLNNLNNINSLNNSQQQTVQPPLPQLPNQLPNQNGMIIMNPVLNGQPTNPMLDHMSILNNTDTMNLNNVNALNSSLAMSNNLTPQFNPTPFLNNLADQNNTIMRDPNLSEVIRFLTHPNPIIKANAAAYLQHLSFMDDSIKQKARSLGSINALIDALNYEIQLLNAQANQQQLTSANHLQTQPSRDVQRNCLGALRNLSFGRQNEENKRSIKAANGIYALVSLLKFSLNDKELKELITGILWNLSSSEEVKTTIIDEAVKDIVNHIIIPGSGWNGRVGVINGVNQDSTYDPLYGTNTPNEIYWSTVFRNSTGVLRNVSSAGEYARRKLRECDGLCESLLFIVRQAIAKNDIDNKSIENTVCVLRNLSYRCQEVVDPDYDKNQANNENSKLSTISPSVTRASALIVDKVSDNFGCFGGSRKKREFSSTNSSNSISTDKQSISKHNGSKNNLNKQTDLKSPTTNHASMQLLWQPDVIQIYLSLLSECSNPETLEAAAGCIQNLCACYWQVSAEIRAAVRKEKGLPVLVELLRMEVDRVVCAVATALRNLALDPRNKELIGKYAMRDLASKLPSNQQHSFDASDDTIAAVLATLNEVVSKNADFAKSFLEVDGVDRLLHIVKFSSKYSPRVVKFTSQLLYNMYQHSDLRETYRKAGYKEAHFLVKQLPNNTGSSNTTTSTISMNSKNSMNSMSANCSANNTLTRPISTQSTTQDNIRTLPKGDFRNLNNGNLIGGAANISTLQRRPSDELQLNDLSIYNNAANLHQPGLITALNPLNAQIPPHLQPQLNQSQQTALAANIYQSSQAVQDEINQLNQRQAAMNGGIYSSGAPVNFVRTEPLYAKVNREKKKQQLNQDQALLLNEEKNEPGGNSWV